MRSKESRGSQASTAAIVFTSLDSAKWNRLSSKTPGLYSHPWTSGPQNCRKSNSYFISLRPPTSRGSCSRACRSKGTTLSISLAQAEAVPPAKRRTSSRLSSKWCPPKNKNFQASKVIPRPSLPTQSFCQCHPPTSWASALTSSAKSPRTTRMRVPSA